MSIQLVDRHAHGKKIGQRIRVCWVQCWPSSRQPLPTIDTDTKLLAFGWDNFTMSQVIEPIVATKAQT